MASGNSAQLMWAVDSTPGVYVTPTVANPMLPGESLEIMPEVLKSGAIIAGRRFPTSDQINGGNIVIGGELPLELYNRGLGKLFRMLIGAVNTTGSGPYTHVFTADDVANDTLTIQVGVPLAGSSTVIPKTLSGCAAPSWQLAGNAGEIVTLGATISAMRGHIGSRVVTDGVTTNTDATVTSANADFTDADLFKPVYGTGIPTGAYIASINSESSIELSAAATADGTGVSVTIGTPLASASYLSDQFPFKYSHGSLSLYGSDLSADCRSFTIDCNNALTEDRRGMGSRYARQAVEGGIREYTGTVTLEFSSTTMYERCAAGTEGAFSLEFAIPGTTDEATIAGNIHLSPFTPKVSDRDLVVQDIPFEFVASSNDASAFTLTLVNSDSTA